MPFRTVSSELANAKEMQALLQKLRSGQEPESTALALSAFGKPAIAPLLYIMDAGDQAPAALDGLQAIGFSEPEEVCEQTSKVLRNRTGLFSWETHLRAIRLGGRLQCPCFEDVLKEYATLLDPPKGGSQCTPRSFRRKLPRTITAWTISVRN